MCMSVLSLHVSVHLVPEDSRRGCQISQNGSYRQLGVVKLALGTVNALNC